MTVRRKRRRTRNPLTRLQARNTRAYYRMKSLGNPSEAHKNVVDAFRDGHAAKEKDEDALDSYEGDFGEALTDAAAEKIWKKSGEDAAIISEVIGRGYQEEDEPLSSPEGLWLALGGKEGGLEEEETSSVFDTSSEEEEEEEEEFEDWGFDLSEDLPPKKEKKKEKKKKVERTPEKKKTVAEKGFSVAEGKRTGLTPFQWTPYDEWRLKKFNLRSPRIKEELGRYFFFLQLDQRTKPIPSVADWTAAVNKGVALLPPKWNQTYKRGKKSPSENPFGNNFFVYLRGLDYFDLPTQLYIPSRYPMVRKEGRKNVQWWSPSMEFISRLETGASALTNFTWPMKEVSGVGKLVGLKFGTEALVGAPIVTMGKGEEAKRWGEPKKNQVDPWTTSWYQMLYNYIPNTLRRKTRTGKFGAYGILVFAEEGGKPVLKQYIPPTVLNFAKLGEVPWAQQSALSNPRRRRRVNSRPKRVIKIVRKVKRR